MVSLFRNLWFLSVIFGFAGSDALPYELEALKTISIKTPTLVPETSHNYLETEQFERAGIEVIWQEFSPANVVYPQAGGEFVPGLSFVDCLFNVGPEEARALVTQAWQPSA